MHTFGTRPADARPASRRKTLLALDLWAFDSLGLRPIGARLYWRPIRGSENGAPLASGQAVSGLSPTNCAVSRFERVIARLDRDTAQFDAERL
ncbi:hypothetical protein GCM10023167_10940 [Brevibacterium pityocampae]|uniref:Uncharacterized protein n=1 Tax=Brevibacterium pityocampae TaxID=506594 RepID=A0ABP8J9A7_9MICO